MSADPDKLEKRYLELERKAEAKLAEMQNAPQGGKGAGAAAVREQTPQAPDRPARTKEEQRKAEDSLIAEGYDPFKSREGKWNDPTKPVPRMTRREARRFLASEDGMKELENRREAILSGRKNDLFDALNSVEPSWKRTGMIEDRKDDTGMIDAPGEQVSTVTDHSPKATVTSREQPTLPPSTGGSTAPVVRRPFELVKIDESHFRLMASTLAGGSSTDIGFDEGDPDPGMVFTVSGDGMVYGKLTINSSGEITNREILNGSSPPANTSTTFHTVIGSYGFTDGVLYVSNNGYGPIEAVICRNWFTSTAPFYGVTWQYSYAWDYGYGW